MRPPNTNCVTLLTGSAVANLILDQELASRLTTFCPQAPFARPRPSLSTTPQWHESEAMTIGLDIDARAPRTSVLGAMSINGAWWVESRHPQADAPDNSRRWWRGAGCSPLLSSREVSFTFSCRETGDFLRRLRDLRGVEQPA